MRNEPDARTPPLHANGSPEVPLFATILTLHTPPRSSPRPRCSNIPKRSNIAKRSLQECLANALRTSSRRAPVQIIRRQRAAARSEAQGAPAQMM